MKKIFTLGLGLLMLASCSSDDDNSIDAAKLTDKKWYYGTTKVLGQTIPYDDHEECGKDYIEFLSTGTLRNVDIWDCEEDVFSIPYTLKGNKVTVSAFGETMTVTIRKVTNTVLEISYKEDFDDNGTEETVIETYTNM